MSSEYAFAISGGLLVLSGLPAAAQVLKLEIVTTIRSPEVQAGEKSRQTINVDLGANQAASPSATTGVTNIMGFDWSSIRDRFELTDVRFEASRVTFNIKGQTASPAVVLPDIDYRFAININKTQRRISVGGCHNKFPSYEIFLNGQRVYNHQQVGSGFTGIILGLAGTCDNATAVTVSY